MAHKGVPPLTHPDRAEQTAPTVTQDDSSRDAMTAPTVIRIRFPRRGGLTMLSAAVVAACVMGTLSGPAAGTGPRGNAGQAMVTSGAPDDVARLAALMGPDGFLGDGTGPAERVRPRPLTRVALVADRVGVPAVADFAIPRTVLDAYQRAARSIAASDSSCHLPWWLLAGIGRIESGHAAGGRVNAAGTTNGTILGPVLNGSLAGTAVIRDTDRGRLDGDGRFDRAVGPMQFVPATWSGYAADGNGDGVASPDNVYDAALTAGRYLCAGSLDLATDDGLTRAILRYNDSASYLKSVMAWGIAYRDGTRSVLDLTGRVPAGSPRRPLSTPPGRTLPAALTDRPSPSSTTSRTSGPTTSRTSTGSSSSSGSSTSSTTSSSSSTSSTSSSSTSTTSSSSTSTSSTTSSSSTSSPSACPTGSPTSTTSTGSPTSSSSSTTTAPGSSCSPTGSPTGSPTSSATSTGSGGTGSPTTRPTGREAGNPPR